MFEMHHELPDQNQESTDTSKQLIRARYLGHVTSYQPIRDQYFLIRSVPAPMDTSSSLQPTQEPPITIQSPTHELPIQSPPRQRIPVKVVSLKSPIAVKATYTGPPRSKGGRPRHSPYQILTSPKPSAFRGNHLKQELLLSPVYVGFSQLSLQHHHPASPAPTISDPRFSPGSLGSISSTPPFHGTPTSPSYFNFPTSSSHYPQACPNLTPSDINPPWPLPSPLLWKGAEKQGMVARVNREAQKLPIMDLENSWQSLWQAEDPDRHLVARVCWEVGPRRATAYFQRHRPDLRLDLGRVQEIEREMRTRLRSHVKRIGLPNSCGASKKTMCPTQRQWDTLYNSNPNLVDGLKLVSFVQPKQPISLLNVRGAVTIWLFGGLFKKIVDSLKWLSHFSESTLTAKRLNLFGSSKVYLGERGEYQTPSVTGYQPIRDQYFLIRSVHATWYQVHQSRTPFLKGSAMSIPLKTESCMTVQDSVNVCDVALLGLFHETRDVVSQTPNLLNQDISPTRTNYLCFVQTRGEGGLNKANFDAINK
eukprot:sb/3463748/